MLRCILLASWSMFLLGPAKGNFPYAKGGGGGQTSCPTPSDTGIIIDTSGSVNRETFRISKLFIIELVMALKTANTDSRQAVFNNAEDTETILKLEEQPPLEQLQQLLETGITHTDGYTWMEAAINVATTDLLTFQRKGVPANLIILTDGKFTDKPIFGDPARAAYGALEKFFNIFVVGIGEDFNMPDLLTLTDDDKQVYILNEKPMLRILKDICLLPVPPPSFHCPQTHDVVFLIDASGSMKPSGFEVAKDVVRRLLRGSLYNTENRQGVIQYSTDATLIFSTDSRFSGYEKDIIIKNLRFNDEYSFTQDAISMGRKELQRTNRGVPRLIVLFSDGKSDNPENAIAEAHQALEEMMDIYALKFGDEDATELEQITDYEDRVFRFGDAAGIQELIDHMLGEMCPLPPTPPMELPKPCLNGMQTMLLLESSKQMRLGNFQAAQVVTRQLAKWARSLVRNSIAVASYGTDVNPIVGLSENLSVYKLDSRIRKMPFGQDPQGHISGAIWWSLKEFEVAAGEGEKILMILGTGLSDARIKDVIASRRAQESGVKIYAINFGGSTGLKHFFYVVRSPSNMWEFQQCTGRNQIVREISLELCPANKTTTNPPTPCQHQCDLVVVIDTSRSWNLPNYKLIKNFASLLLATFPAANDTQIGLVTAGTEPRVWLNITTKYRPLIVRMMIMGVPFRGGQLALEESIRLVRTSFYGGSHRYFVPKTILYINNEATSHSSSVVGEAHVAREKRINVTTIGIGNEIDHEALELIAGNASDAFFVERYSTLMHLLEPISNHVCNPEWIRKPSTCPKSNDIVFVVDSSSWSGRENFIFSTEMVARLLPAYLGTGRVGMVTYGGGVTEVIHLNSQGPEEQRQDAVLTARFTDGEGNAGNALRAARNMLGIDVRCGQRQPKASTVVLVSRAVTDLANSEQQAQMIRAQFADTFVLQTGEQLTPYQVQRLAGGPENMQIVMDHQQLFSSIVAVGRNLCREPPSLPSCCEPSNDVVFLVDASSGSGKQNFGFSLEFVARIFPATAANGRIGVITFGDTTNQVISLWGQSSVQEMQETVLNAQYSGGEGIATDALRQALEMFRFGSSCRQGQQSKSSSVVILCHAIDDVESAANQAKFIRAQGVTTFVLAVGNQLSPSTVERLAGRREDMAIVMGPRELFDSVGFIGQQICRVPPVLPSCCQKGNDVIFVVDASGGSGRDDFEFSKNFVARLLPATRATGRVAVITYGSTTNNVINLSSQGPVDEMQKAVLNAPYSGGDGRVGESLKRAVSMIGLGPGPCDPIRKEPGTTVVILCYRVVDMDAAIAKTENLRFQRVNTIVVAVGNQIPRSEVEKLAGSQRAAHLVADAKELISSTVAVNYQLCINPPTPLCCAEWTRMKYVPPQERSIYLILGTANDEVTPVYYCRYHDQAGNVVPGSLVFNDDEETAHCYAHNGLNPGDKTDIDDGEVMLHRHKVRGNWNNGIIPTNACVGGYTKNGDTLYLADYYCIAATHWMCGWVHESNSKFAHVYDYEADSTRDVPQNKQGDELYFFVC